jgi:Tol biopolymer transport system component/DNA-binding winged helix-turn-helix (wHTH) protein
MVSRANRLYEFGPFRLDMNERVLLRDGQIAPLTPKAFDTLVVLVENNGHVLEKEELLKAVWPDTFVEEATLAQNIFTLRKVLGKEPSYIETIPKRGYRFTANVLTHDGQSSASPNGAGAHAASPVAAPEPAARPSEFLRYRNLLILMMVVVTATAGIGFGLFQYFSRKPEATRPTPPFQSMEITRLPITSRAVEAAVSPSGKYIVYTESDGAQSGLWLKQVATTGTPTEIVPTVASNLRGATFSPDEEYIYYVGWKTDEKDLRLYRVPALGGTAMQIASSVNSPATFSPDGRRIAFTREEENRRSLLVTANADGSDERVLASRDQNEVLTWPAWSPDGRTIACAVNSFDTNGGATVVGFDAVSGDERPLGAQRWFEIVRLAWLGNASTLSIAAAEQELSPVQIYQLDTASGDVQRVTNDLNSYDAVTATANGNALVAMQTDRVTSIWTTPNGKAQDAAPLTSGAGKLEGYYGVAWMPDGHIVYASIASGAWDIWKMDADGRNAIQLTAGARSNYGPSVSPDGRYIVFGSNRGGAFNIWRIDSDGGNPKQLTAGSGESFAHVTADSRWVVYATNGYATLGSKKPAVYKVPIDGGEPVLLNDQSASWPFTSPDGKSVVCTYQPAAGDRLKLAILPIEGGPPSKTFDLPPGFEFNTVWSPDGRGICYLNHHNSTANVWLMPLDGGAARPLSDFKTNGVLAYDLSRTRGLVCARSTETTSVVLIKNLR